MRISLNNILAMALAFLPVLASAQEQEKKIGRSDLPPAVEKTVADQIKNATIKGFSKEQENGKTFYEAELLINGHSKDILMDQTGAIREVEEEVSAESLPARVREGLQAKAGQGKVVKVESLSKNGKLVAYEARILTNGKKSEIQVGPDGRPLGHEE
jgi:uncharacterized membrane protein YkoI